MPKVAPDAMLDGSLDYVAGSTEYYICSGASAPANRAGAIAAALIGPITMDAADFAKANGDTSGRKLTVAAQAGVNVVATGDTTHAVLTDATSLRYVTEVVQRPVVNGDTANLPAWDIEIADPT